MPKQSHKTNRQIKRNITDWKAEPRKPENPGSPADALFHILAALVAALLPLSLFTVSAGIVFRMPDLMAFEIDRSGVLMELGLETTPTEIANEISGYLRHEKDGLDLTVEIARTEVPVFSFMDEVNLEKIRALLDKVFFPSIFALALSGVLFVVCRLAKRMRYLKHAMRASAVLFICILCLVLALSLLPPFREMVFAWQPGVRFSYGELLPHLFGGLYPIISGGMTCLISFIIYITLYSVSKRFTIEKETMFS